MYLVKTNFGTTLLLLAAFVLLFTSNIFSQDLEIYVSDAGNFSSPPWQILKFDENGENPEVFIDDSLAWPQDILFLEDQGVVLISNLNSGKITKHNSSTGAYIEDFATGIGGPTRIKIGADSLLYVLQWGGTGKVLRYELDGTFVDEFTSVGVAQSIGIDWDNDGNLYVSSYTGDIVRKFDTTGNDLGIFVNSNLLGPTNIWFDDKGDLLVSDYNGTAVKRFDSTGNYVNDFLTGLGNSEGVDFLPNGNILIGNGATSSVKMFDSSGNYIEDFIPGGSGNLLRPNAVVIRETNVSSVSSDGNPGDKSFILEQNYPNPFNPTTKIKFALPFVETHRDASLPVTLKVYNVLGNEIATLVDEYKPAGSYVVEFNASELTSGIYFYKLQAGQGFVETKKLILLK
ncbi:MAG: T9SS type A sorting domain-containing protein [Ignavibacteriaceae bacterium]